MAIEHNKDDFIFPCWRVVHEKYSVVKKLKLDKNQIKKVYEGIVPI